MYCDDSDQRVCATHAGMMSCFGNFISDITAPVSFPALGALRRLSDDVEIAAIDTAHGDAGVKLTFTFGVPQVTSYVPTNPSGLRAAANGAYNVHETPPRGCVIDASGAARCFGANNGAGQLGVGDHSNPPGLSKVVQP